MGKKGSGESQNLPHTEMGKSPSPFFPHCLPFYNYIKIKKFFFFFASVGKRGMGGRTFQNLSILCACDIYIPISPLLGR